MPQSRFVLDLLAGRRLLTAPEVGRLAAWWAVSAPGSGLAEALVWAGVLPDTAPHTLRLMQLGAVAADPALVFGPAELAALRAGPLAPPPPRAVEPDPPTDPGRPADPPPRVTATPAAILKADTARLPSFDRYGSAVPQVGGVLGKCRITALLGAGGEGLVYSAHHRTLNIPVAVKVLMHDGRAPAAAERGRLLREAQALARVSHPNVVRVLDFDDDPMPYAVLELVDGPSLADRIAETGGLPAATAIGVVAQAAAGLAAAWAEGLVHRDVKPGNILLTRDGAVKVSDLGLVLAAGGPADGRGTVGTAAYMAPEQAADPARVDHRADQYALGATFFHAVTGRLPFPGRSAAQMLLRHATEAPVPPHLVAPHLAQPDVSAVVLRMLAKSPADRFQSYEALIDALFALPRRRPPGGAVTLCEDPPPSADQ